MLIRRVCLLSMSLFDWTRTAMNRATSTRFQFERKRSIAYVVFRWIRVETKKSNPFELKSIHCFCILDAVIGQGVLIDGQWVLKQDERFAESSRRSESYWIDVRKKTAWNFFSVFGIWMNKSEQINKIVSFPYRASNQHLQSIIESNFAFIRMRDPMNEAFRFRHTFIGGFLTGNFELDRFIIGILDELMSFQRRSAPSTYSNHLLDSNNETSMTQSTGLTWG